MKRIATGVLAVLALTLGLTAPAQAVTRQYFKTTVATHCLFGGNLTGETGLVATRTCAASNNMVWIWSGRVEKGSYSPIKGAAQERCLDSNSAGSVYMHRCHNVTNQLWTVYKNDERGWLMIQNGKTDLCLTHLSSLGGVTAHRCNTGDSTQWWRAANRP